MSNNRKALDMAWYLIIAGWVFTLLKISIISTWCFAVSAGISLYTIGKAVGKAIKNARTK